MINNGNNHKPVWFKKKDEIKDHFNWSEAIFRCFYNAGMPVLKMNGQYMGHRENIEEWLKVVSSKQADVDELIKNLPKAHLKNLVNS